MHDSLGHELTSSPCGRAPSRSPPASEPTTGRLPPTCAPAAADATDRLRPHHRRAARGRRRAPVRLTPAGETLEQLVARAAESGLPVRWDPAGHGPAADADEVAERLLHRVAREALTNAARHAPGAPVSVAVTGHQGSGHAPSPSPTAARHRHRSRPRRAVRACSGCAPPSPRSAATSGGPARRRLPRPGPRPGRTDPRRPARTPSPTAPFARARRRVALGLAAAAGRAWSWSARPSAGTPTPRPARSSTPRAYAPLRPGTAYDEIAPVLPDREARDPPTDRAPAPEPPDADCRYYRASGELLVSIDHFRLCFDDRRRLLAKDVVPGVDSERAGTHQQADTHRQEEFAR